MARLDGGTSSIITHRPCAPPHPHLRLSVQALFPILLNNNPNVIHLSETVCLASLTFVGTKRRPHGGSAALWPVSSIFRDRRATRLPRISGRLFG